MFKGTLVERCKLVLCLCVATGLLAIFNGSSAWAQRDPSDQEPVKLPMGDIVFVMDESGSFFDDAMAVDANVNEIVRLVEGVIDYQVGIVGFGGYEGHMGTSYSGQPYVNLRLTSDMKAFSKALKTLVTNGTFEYGFDAVKLAMSDALGFRPGASVCAVMITDEDADLLPQDPVTREEAIAAMKMMKAYYLGVVEYSIGTTMSDYGPLAGSLAQVMGGKVFDIREFRKDPAPVLREIITSCVNQVKNGTPEPTTPDTSTPVNIYVTIEELNALKLVITGLVDGQTMLLARLSEIIARLDALEAAVQAGFSGDLDERFSAITLRLDEFDRNFARINVTFENIEANFNQYNLRLNGAEQGLASLRTTVAGLQESNNSLTIRVQGLEERIENLESFDLEALIAWRAEAGNRLAALEEQLKAFGTEFASIHATLNELRNSDGALGAEIASLTERLAALEAQTGELFGSLSQRVDALQSQLNAFDARFQEIDALRQAVDGQQQEINQLKALVDNWDEEIAGLKSAMDALDSRLLNLEDILTARIQENEASIEAVKKELEGTNAELAQLLKNLDENSYGYAFQRDLDSLSSSLGTRIQSLLRRIQSLEAAGAGPDPETRAQLENLSNLIAELQGKLADLEAAQSTQYTELLARITDNEGKDARLESWLAEIAAWLGVPETTAGVTTFDERINALDGRITDLASQLDKNQKSMGDLQKSLTGLQAKLDELAKQMGTESSAIDPARLRAAQRLAELAFLTAVAAIGISLLFFLSKS